MKEQPLPPRRKFTRRAFIGYAAGFAVGETIALTEKISPKKGWNKLETMIAFRGTLSEQFMDYRNAHQENREFLDNNPEILEKMTFGCSFAPEEFVFGHNLNPEDYSHNYNEAIDALKWTTDERGLNIRNVRLGIRWNVSELSAGNVDFGFYKPFLDHCLKNNISVCLNIGPIKTFRAPEEHVTQSIENLPPPDSIITPQTDLVKNHVDNYLNKLFSFLKTSYSKEELANILMIQPDNEPFHKMGEKKWAMDDSYIRMMIEKIHQNFPDVGILLTSAGYRNLQRISNNFSQITSDLPQLKDKLISGYNYYCHPVPLPGLDLIDTITVAKSLGDVCEINRRNAKKVGFGIETSEGQAEPWGDEYTVPGNSVAHFRFMTLRNFRHVLRQDVPGKSVVRIWGVEYMAKFRKNPSPEQAKIIEFIRMVTGAQLPPGYSIPKIAA